MGRENEEKGMAHCCAVPLSATSSCEQQSPLCTSTFYAPFHRVKIPGQTRKFIMSCNDNRAEFKSSWEAQEIKTTNCLLCIIHSTTAKSAYQLNDIYELCMRPRLRQECMVNFTRFLQKKKKRRWYHLDQNNFFPPWSIHCWCENYSSSCSNFLHFPTGVCLCWIQASSQRGCD